MSKELKVGVEFIQPVEDLNKAFDVVSDSEKNACDLVCARMRNDEEIKTSVRKAELLSEDNFWRDTMLTRFEWKKVMALLPNLEELEDSNTRIMHGANQVTKQLIDFYEHLGISTFVFQLNGPSSCHLAEIINTKLHQHPNLNFWAKAALEASSNERSFSSWNLYNQFRKIFGNPNITRKVKVILRIGQKLPDDDQEIDRWNGENVAAICIPLAIFETNTAGYPVLPKRHQKVIKKFFRHCIPVILEFDGRPEEVTVEFHRQYLVHLSYKYWDEDEGEVGDPYYSTSVGWENYLQPTLQPYADNLKSDEYVDFEQDSEKYHLYFTAICNALHCRLDLESEKFKLTKAQMKMKDFTLVIFVAGAGPGGPLVIETLRASEITEIKVKIYAIDKNRHAHHKLKRLNEIDWNSEVVLVCEDMRYWNAPEKADVIVSELLGSLGDNELSPECLDGAQKFLKDSGVMIPQKYTSYICPIMSDILYTQTAYYNGTSHISNESPMIAYMTKKFDIAEPKELFTFIHPNPELLSKCHTNERYCKLEFNIDIDCECHGFAGYFDSVLFENEKTGKQVKLSIHPDTYSEDLFSWYPVYVPLREGITLKKGNKLVAAFWRRTDSAKVWYEYTVLSPVTLARHNVNGKKSNMSLDIGTG